METNLLLNPSFYYDIGGESTRPNAIKISIEEEIERLIPIFERLKKEEKKIVFSVDTTKLKIAKLGIDCGASGRKTKKTKKERIIIK